MAPFLFLFLASVPGEAPKAAATGRDPLPPGAIARLGTRRLRHADFIRLLDFSPDGKRLAAAGHKTVRVWGTKNGRGMRRFTTRGLVSALAFSPDGQFLAIAHGANPTTILLWDLNSGAETGTWSFPGDILFLGFSPGGKKLAAASRQGASRAAVLLWNLKTGKKRTLATFSSHAWSWNFAFAPDGQSLAAPGDDFTAGLYDVATGKLVRGFLGHESAVTALAFAPDGQSLVTGSEDTTIRLWKIATEKEYRRFEGHQGQIARLVFSADGKLLASQDRNYQVRLWDLLTARELPTCRRQGDGGMALSASGRLMALASTDKTIDFWQVPSGKPHRPFPGHRGPIVSLAFAPKGKTLASSGADQTLILWDLDRRRVLRKVDHPAGPVLWSSPSRLVLPDTWGTSLVYDLAGETASPKKEHFLQPFVSAPLKKSFLIGPNTTMDGVSAILQNLALSRDGKWLALVKGNPQKQQIYILDRSKGQESCRFSLFGETLLALAFSPESRELLAAVRTVGRWNLTQGYLVSWDLPTGRENRRQAFTWPATNRAAYAPNGRMLVLACDDGRVRLWEVASARERRRWLGHQGPVTSARFSPNGASLASGSDDTTILLWDVYAPDDSDLSTALKTKVHPARLWLELGATDAVAAFRAMRLLIHCQNQTVPFLRDRLRPVQPQMIKSFYQRVADLDSPGYDARRKAMDELQAALARGDVQPETLKKAVHDQFQGQPSLETARRVQRLLQNNRKLEDSEQRLRLLRCLEVLQQINTAPARDLLETIARGADQAWLTREARASLRGLNP